MPRNVKALKVDILASEGIIPEDDVQIPECGAYRQIQNRDSPLGPPYVTAGNHVPGPLSRFAAHMCVIS
jgi:hypothetical protein